MKPYNLVIGTTMIDIFGYSPNCSKLKGCNPGRVKMSFGGVSRNIVENMVRIGVPTKFISAFGDDLYGLEMYHVLKHLGCDLADSIVVKDHQSASFMAITDASQNVLSAIADSEIMKYLSDDYLKSKQDVIKGAQYVIFDSNDYHLFDAFLKKHQDVHFIVDPVSPFKAKQIKHLLPYLHTVKPNRKEAEVLCEMEIKNTDDLQKAGRILRQLGVENVFITCDEEGVYYFNGKEEGIMKVDAIDIVNETGAGDAFVAGISYGYTHELTFLETVKFAYSMAICNLGSQETVDSTLTLEKVKKVMDETKWMNQVL